MSTQNAEAAAGRELAADMREQLGGTEETREELEAEVALCAIWLDSGSGPSPETWTDKQWKRYIRSRRP